MKYFFIFCFLVQEVRHFHFCLFTSQFHHSLFCFQCRTAVSIGIRVTLVTYTTKITNSELGVSQQKQKFVIQHTTHNSKVCTKTNCFEKCIYEPFTLWPSPTFWACPVALTSDDLAGTTKVCIIGRHLINKQLHRYMPWTKHTNLNAIHLNHSWTQ